MVRDHHAVSVPKFGNTVANGNNLAYQFVAKYRTGRRAAMEPLTPQGSASGLIVRPVLGMQQPETLNTKKQLSGIVDFQILPRMYLCV